MDIVGYAEFSLHPRCSRKGKFPGVRAAFMVRPGADLSVVPGTSNLRCLRACERNQNVSQYKPPFFSLLLSLSSSSFRLPIHICKVRDPR